MSERKVNKERIEILINELTSGITKCDTLWEPGHDLTGEAEAMYFLELGKFFETSLSRHIVKRKQDIYEGEFKTKKMIKNR